VVLTVALCWIVALGMSMMDAPRAAFLGSLAAATGTGVILWRCPMRGLAVEYEKLLTANYAHAPEKFRDH